MPTLVMKVRVLLGRRTDMHSKTFRADIELSGLNIGILGRFLTFRADIVTAFFLNSGRTLKNVYTGEYLNIIFFI